MYNFIFKSEKIKKGRYYIRLKEILEEAGWKNISSRPSTDNDVFFSKGEAGDKEMIFRIKEYDGSSTAASVSASVSRGIDISLQKSYTPGTNGAAGTFEYGVTWQLYLMARSEIYTDTEMTIHYHCNKNRLIIIADYPIGIANSSSFLFIGLSDNTVGKEEKNTSPILISSNVQSPSIRATAQPDTVRTAPYALTSYCMLPPKAISASGEIFMTEIPYGSAEEGIRGYVDGIYSLPANAPVRTGDTIMVEDKKFYILDLATVASGYLSAFNSRFIAFRVE